MREMTMFGAKRGSSVVKHVFICLLARSEQHLKKMVPVKRKKEIKKEGCGCTEATVPLQLAQFHLLTFDPLLLVFSRSPSPLPVKNHIQIKVTEQRHLKKKREKRWNEREKKIVQSVFEELLCNE